MWLAVDEKKRPDWLKLLFSSPLSSSGRRLDRGSFADLRGVLPRLDPPVPHQVRWALHYLYSTWQSWHYMSLQGITLRCIVTKCLDFYLFSLRRDSLHWGQWNQVYLCNFEGTVGKERRSRKRLHQAKLEPMTSRWSGHSSNHCATTAAVLLDC